MIEDGPVSTVSIEKNGRPMGKSFGFVDYIIKRCSTDKGVQAVLKRADNPNTEYQSWEILAGFKVDLEDELKRLPYGTIAAAIARTESKRNGILKIGQAIALSYREGNQDDQAKMKLRRLLACDSVTEVVRILRPTLRLIESRSVSGLDYATLLDDLLWFGNDASQTRIKSRWAQGFYGSGVKVEDEND